MAVYFSARVCTPWVAGRVHDWIFPLLAHPEGESRLQLLLSHIFLFSFVPAFFAGLMNYRYKQTSALFVWVVPTLVLGYQFCTFPTSTFQNHFATAYNSFFQAASACLSTGAIGKCSRVQTPMLSGAQSSYSSQRLSLRESPTVSPASCRCALPRLIALIMSGGGLPYEPK